MQTYSVLLEFARKFANQARVTTDREVARELCRMAIEYQDKAAALDNGEYSEFRYVIGWRHLCAGVRFTPAAADRSGSLASGAPANSAWRTRR